MRSSKRKKISYILHRCVLSVLLGGVGPIQTCLLHWLPPTKNVKHKEKNVCHREKTVSDWDICRYLSLFCRNRTAILVSCWCLMYFRSCHHGLILQPSSSLIHDIFSFLIQKRCTPTMGFNTTLEEFCCLFSWSHCFRENISKVLQPLSHIIVLFSINHLFSVLILCCTLESFSGLVEVLLSICYSDDSVQI